ncbi:WD40-repeat-containing domain protein [Mycotypha africana]|uniref:WD40-repeat-containing domain protein n=1 Tax=Mycotypha africana TaxID=64632 RepID=UPI0022FFE2CC|nr:WD40-repeat-containing domain protein [Mycotypha africana]KAI8977201.1 WD40-repeat-containing domain protein [Mycotypha africana]
MNLSRSAPSINDAPGLLYAGFNQDYGCFAVGLNNGFRVYNCDPLIEQARDESDEGGIAIVEMLYRTNYLALVGGGRNHRYPPNKVIIYDSMKGKAVLEVEYKSEVKNVKLRRDRLIVVLQNKVFVYQFSLPLQLLYTFDTCDNPKGLAAVSKSLTHAILVIPGRQKGHLQIIDLNSLGYYISVGESDQSTSPLYPFQQPHVPPQSNTRRSINVNIIAAHSGKLSCISLNQDGTRCATTSDKGTLIRVFNTATGSLLHELRRGMDRAEIYSIAFNHESTRLCVSSDKGTIHIFNLDPSVVTQIDQKPRGPTYGEVVTYPTQSPTNYGLTTSGNRGSALSFMKDLLPKYFSSEWSFANAKLATESRCIVAFGSQKNSLIAICADGSCYKFYFDPRKGGECTRESFVRFLKQE